MPKNQSNGLSTTSNQDDLVPTIKLFETLNGSVNKLHKKLDARIVVVRPRLASDPLHFWIQTFCLNV